MSKTFTVEVSESVAEAMMAAAVAEVRRCKALDQKSRATFGGPVITADTAEERMHIEVRRQGCIRFLQACVERGWPYAQSYLSRAMEA